MQQEYNMPKKQPSPKSKRKKRIIIWSCVLVVLAVLIFCAFYVGLVVRHYTIKTDKLNEGQNVRIVIIADLHSTYYGENQERLIRKIEKQNPDIIALVGDIIDDHESEEGAKDFLEGIQGIAPAYYVIGNHEVWTCEYERMKEMVADYGHTVLTNESKTIEVNGIELCISGVDDPYVLKYSNDEDIRSMQSEEELLYGFEDINNSVFNILLAHRPELYSMYQKYDFDLVLSGHAHGGQIRIPGIVNGFFAPDQGFLPEYAGGRYEENGQTMIVSRGLGFNSLVPRIFNPPEVVVVDIKG